MKKIESKKLSIPLIYLIENDAELSSMPYGIPFIRGKSKDYEEYVRLIEFEVLLKSAIASGLPFNWRRILIDNGYDVSNFIETVASSSKGVLIEVSSDYDIDISSIEYTEYGVGEYLMDISYQVDIEVIKSLHILPTWLTDIEEAVKVNILNTITYNPNLYNKKLDLVSGGVELSTPEKNLIIIDISSSIPKSISKAILLLSKTMSYQFYADVLITGSKSTLYDYSMIDSIDVKEIYTENGTDNDQVYFKKLVSEPRKYNSVIIFGDNHSPSQDWSNAYNKRTSKIPIIEGIKLNKWTMNKIYSFHTTDNTTMAGYGDWFDCKDVVHMENWVKYLD